MFKETLDKLSIASHEAVVDGTYNTLDEFKNYMHIDRPVEKILEDIILKSIDSNKSKLILISGNVGDGKSHMLAKLFQKFPEQMNLVEVRNDATESNFINKSWMEELEEFLTPFKDEHLNDDAVNCIKIVAINLGVLSKFITEKESSFGALKSFVDQKGIIDNLNYDNKFDENSTFQFVNLADFKLFELTANTVQSVIISQLLQKITQQSDDNEVYQSFKEFYKEHPYKDSCIIRYNYLQLSNPIIQEGLTKIIVYTLVKNKLILSIRDLLNFVYDLIVPYAFQSLSSDQIKSDKNYLKPNFIFENSYCFKLFESTNRSALLTHLKETDPLLIREEFIDNLIFNLNSSRSPEEIFTTRKINFPSTLFHMTSDTNKFRDSIIKLFVRELFIQDTRKFESFFLDFENFCSYLFAYYTGESKKLQSLYDDITQAIQKWNGSGRASGEVNIPIGKHQIDYSITQRISFRPKIKALDNKQDVLNELDYSLPICLIVDQKEYCFTLDFNLYTLLQKVKEGYSPNKKDKEDHIDFQNFVNLIINKSIVMKDELNFEKIIGNQVEKFELSLNMFGEYTFKKL